MRNKSKLMIVMCIMIAVMAIGYGAFSTVLNITGTASITSDWKVVFTNITQQSKTNGVSIKTQPSASGTTATFDVGLTSPGDKIVYKITLANEGTLDAIVTDIVASATDSPAIIFSVTDISIGYELKQKTTKDFLVTIEYDPYVTTQPEKLNKTLTVNIVTEQKINQSVTPGTPNVQQPLYLSSSILRDNVSQADTNIDFSLNNNSCYFDKSIGDYGEYVCGELDSNGKGLYYTNTNTENNGTTYYFRGDVQNNFVKFGKNSQGKDMIWRIVRINEDGSIKLVYYDELWGAFNLVVNDTDSNAYVGYMYGELSATGDNAYKLTHTNTTSSNVKTALENWYATNLLSYSSHIADSGFCNDRSVATTSNTWASDDTALGYGTNKTYYGAYDRIVNEKQPQFECPNENRDLFTTSTSNKGNKAATYPIGLLTADEMVYAGGFYSSGGVTDVLGQNNTSYLSFFYEWGPNYSMSPMYYFNAPYGGTSGAHIWYFHNSTMSGYESGDDISIAVYEPVINLKSTVELSAELPEGCTRLDGTQACPYIIKTN